MKGRRLLSVERWLRILGGFFLLLLVASVIGMTAGQYPIGIDTIRDLIAGQDAGTTERTILFQIRLPRVLLAALVGAYLATAGVILQALLRNPLADPFILGISSGAALGAYFAMGLGIQASLWGLGATPLLAFVGGLVSVWIVYQMGRVEGRVSGIHLLLAGVIVNAIFSALILFLISVIEPGRVTTILQWMMGHLGSPGYGVLAMLAVYGLMAGGALLVLSKPLNLITLGEEAAQSLGVDVERLKRVLLLLSTLLAALAVSFTGLIGFIGVVAPHLVRLLVGPDHRLLLPGAALLGASFLILADTAARVVVRPSELPVGVMTALIGGPFFLYLLRQRKGYR